MLAARPMTNAHHPARIHLKLRELAQLFNSMDPSPFLDRDLDHDAEEFIVSWAREFPRDQNFELVVHLTTPPESDKAANTEHAVRHYFANRAEIKRREFRLLLRRGHLSLTIGLLFLATCLFLSSFAGRIGYEPFQIIAREGLIIAGWVAMWRPLEIFLYDWWPMRAEWLILQRLAHMKVRLQSGHTAPELSPGAEI
jgi:hypothetical protein